MANANSVLSEAGNKRVEAAIADAESRTSGELVVCLATRSGDYDRGEDLVGVCFALAAVTIAWLLIQDVYTASWGPSIVLGLLQILGLIVVGFSLGAALATRIPILGTLFVTRSQMQTAVRDRAAASFVHFGVRGTRAATGILIYVSILERMVWVLGDAAVSDTIEQSEWDAVRDAVVDGFARKQAEDGLLKAVQIAGELLAAKLPGTHDDTDELANRVRIIN